MSVSEYFEWYVLYIPHEVYWVGGLAFLVLLFIMTAWKGWQGARYAFGFLLAEYVALLMYFTVFYRNATAGYELRLMPLWSYKAINQGISVLLHEVVMNVAVFVPIGILLGLILKDLPWWKVMIPGVCISIAIELLQLILKRGVCETDDVLHNSLGCFIGLWIVQTGSAVVRKKG